MTRQPLAALLLLLLAACATPGSPGTSGGEQVVERPASLSALEVPPSATVGQPVSVSAYVAIGPSSCNSLKGTSLEVDPAARTVRFTGTIRARTGPDVRCTRDMTGQTVTESFTPDAPGTWVVQAGEASAAVAVTAL